MHLTYLYGAAALGCASSGPPPATAPYASSFPRKMFKPTLTTFIATCFSTASDVWHYNRNIANTLIMVYLYVCSLVS